MDSTTSGSGTGGEPGRRHVDDQSLGSELRASAVLLLGCAATTCGLAALAHAAAAVLA